MEKYSFKIEKRDIPDRYRRDLVVRAVMGKQSFGLPAISRTELELLYESIKTYLES